MTFLFFELLDSCALTFAWTTTPGFDFLGLDGAAAFANGAQNALVDIGDDMENAELMVSLGPDLFKRPWIEGRAVTDDRLRLKTPVFQVLHEPSHVRGVVARDQCAADRVIGNRVAGQQNHAATKVDFIDAQDATELFQDVLPECIAVELADRIFERRVNIARGKLEQEITLHALLDRGQVLLVLQNAIDDCLPDFVIVFRFEVDTRRMAVKRFAATAVGSILGVVNFKPKYFLIAQ